MLCASIGAYFQLTKFEIYGNNIAVTLIIVFSVAEMEDSIASWS